MLIFLLSAVSILLVGGGIAVLQSGGIAFTRLPPLLLVVETANCPILSSANINPRDDFPFAHRHFYQKSSEWH